MPGNSISPFDDFYGNPKAAATLSNMLRDGRIPQTILLSGPEGVGKCTLARRFGAALLGHPETQAQAASPRHQTNDKRSADLGADRESVALRVSKQIEADDLSRPANVAMIQEREKWAAEKRADDPLLFSTHPDFVTFAPDGPLRQLSIQQMRSLRDRAAFRPLSGAHRIFLIRTLDRANEQAANSLLKLLEEPPPYVILLATVNNLFDLLPTIRSRAVILPLSRLDQDQMMRFVSMRGLADAQLRVDLSEGSPGVAVRLDLDEFRKRRGVWLAAFECGARIQPFSAWLKESEHFSSSSAEKLDRYLPIGYGLLHDLLAFQQGASPSANRDIAARLQKLSARVSFPWIVRATAQLDELAQMVRRNIQKAAALDAFIMNLRNSTALQSD